MKFALSIPTLTGFPRAGEPEGGWRERYARTYELLRVAEDFGFDFGTIGQHRFTPENIDSSAPLVTLAALAARTRTLRLCTNILLLPTHDPIELAEQAGVLDEISDGRLILGFGIGYRPYEFERIGLDYRQRARRTEEAIDVLRRAWRDEPLTFEGRFFQVHGANVSPKPVQKPGPPIWLGGLVDAAISRAARLADGWLTDNIESMRSLGPKIARYRQEAAAHGRSGTVALNRRVGIGASRARVEAEWLPKILDTIRNYIRMGVTFQDPDFVQKAMTSEPMGLDDIPQGQLIAGTPADCIEAIRLILTESDPDYIICDFGRGAHGADYERLKAAIELFGREVMPHFA